MFFNRFLIKLFQEGILQRLNKLPEKVVKYSQKVVKILNVLFKHIILIFFERNS